MPWGVGRDTLDQEETEGRKLRLEAAGLWDGRRVQLRRPGLKAACEQWEMRSEGDLDVF